MAIRIIVTVLFSGITQYHTVTDFMYKSIFFLLLDRFVKDRGV